MSGWPLEWRKKPDGIILRILPLLLLFLSLQVAHQQSLSTLEARLVVVVVVVVVHQLLLARMAI